MKTKGKYLQQFVDGKPMALATSCSLNATMQFDDARTKDDPEGPAPEPDYIDWSVSSENILGYNEDVTAEMLYNELMEIFTSKRKVEIYIEQVVNPSAAVPNTGWKPDTATNKAFAPYGGYAYVESVTLNAPVDGKATVSVNYKGYGTLAKKATASQTSTTEQ